MDARKQTRAPRRRQAGRTPQIQADAAYAILTSAAGGFTGNQCIDEQARPLARGESVIKYRSPLNVLTDTHSHSCD